MEYSNNPYAKEIMDLLNNGDPTKMVVVKRGASIGCSSCTIDPAVGYMLRESPYPVPNQYLINDSDLPAIKEVIDVREYIREQNQPRRKRKP